MHRLIAVMPRTSLMLTNGHFRVLYEFGELLLVKADPTRYVEIAWLDLGRNHPRMLKYPP